MALKPKGLLLAAGLAVIALGISAGGLFAQQAQPQVAKPEAAIEIVAVPANAANANAIMGVNGAGAKVAMGTTGLDNVSVGVPVLLAGSAPNGATIAKYAWTITVPAGSTAKLDATDKAQVKFTPDVSGIYKVDLVTSNPAGSSAMASVQIHAGEYMGVTAGNCAQCHPGQTHEWAETGHGEIFHEEINGGVEPAISHYGEGCVRCHTTGYYLGADNGGFTDVQAEIGWKFPALADIQQGGQWDQVPGALKNMANIQCEDCHGPAKDHVEKGGKMAVSLDEGVCNICHDGGGHHIKGSEFVNSGHGDRSSEAWTHPVGPGEQACVRCHSGKGFISFLKNPTEVASWDNDAQNATCAVCHEPHSAANKWQLRITGKPVEVAGVTKDYGLSTTCVECHNGRRDASGAQRGSYPHYSVAAEMLSDTGGVTYGQTVPNTLHGMIVGAAPVKNPDTAAAEETPFLFGGVAPGACVACHMWPTPADAKDPNRFKVGEHSFNMTSPDGTFEYTASCQSCHPGITSFNITAKADYDGNGAVEGVEQEVAGLVNLLQKAIGESGIRPIQGNPYFNRDDLAKADEKQKNAIFNYRFVRGAEGADGKANAIHNFKRSVSLLQLSYKDLTGQDVPGATLMK